MDSDKSSKEENLDKWRKTNGIRAIHFLSKIINTTLCSKLVLTIHKIYLKRKGFNDKEIRFIQMIHSAQIRGHINQLLRKYQR